MPVRILSPAQALNKGVHAMCCRITLTVLFVLCCAPVALAQTSDRPAGIDEKSREIVKQLTKAVEEARNFSVEVQHKAHVFHEGREFRSDRTHKITVEKPFKIAIIHTAGDPGISVAWDGKTVSSIYPSRNGPVYSSRPYAKPDHIGSLADFWSLTPGRVTDDDRVMPYLLSSHPSQEMLSAYSMQYVGVEDVEGAKCHKLKEMLEERGEWYILVEQSNPPVIREVRMIVEGKSAITAYYRNWKFDIDLPADQFSLTKPEGAIAPKAKRKRKSKESSSGQE